MQSAVLATGALPFNERSHIVLLGDSVFDNASYTGGRPDVITRLRDRITQPGKATLLAVDGATTDGMATQIARLPRDATHLVVSVGGNNALRRADILDLPVKSSAATFDALARLMQEFEADYRAAINACRRTKLPLAVCTIYNGNFPDAAYQRRVAAALSCLNDVLIRVASEQRAVVIELRRVCTEAADYANPIEPSTIGAAKIADAILRAVKVLNSGNPPMIVW